MRDLSIVGNKATDVNFANISDQVKIVDTFKYYQQSLAGLSAIIM